MSQVTISLITGFPVTGIQKIRSQIIKYNKGFE